MAFTNQVKSTAPLYAVVGAGDALVAGLRATLPSVDDVENVVSEVWTIPGQVRQLPDRAEIIARDALSGATHTYTSLVLRGENLVGRIRRQQATEDLRRQSKSTASRAKATATTARRSAKQTTSSARGATTSARKTAAAAKKAAAGAADKTGS